ncbi:MAG TPA: YciI family protein [Propionibacteriaceae bacterium]|nr:YciI family protein [Propionibacteriaceae bacterium]
MKYLMLVGNDPDADPNESDEGTLDIDTWVSTNQEAGRWIMGDRLRPTEDATTVRRRSGKVLVTDGPFAESREWIVGFDILECRDLDEAIEIAAQHPQSAGGRLELRPFWPLDGTGE